MVMHKPSEELLIDYASGALPEPVALAVATHAALCLESSEVIADFEAAGGALLDDLEPADLRDGALDRVMNAIDLDGDRPSARDANNAKVDDETRSVVPSPLLPYLRGNLSDLDWRRKGRAVRSAPLNIVSDDYEVRLLEIEPGRPVPVHTHEGMEITLTLRGGYSDGDMKFGRGDFQLADSSVEHKPIADPGEPCVCLVVLSAPMRLTGRLGRLVDPFVKLQPVLHPNCYVGRQSSPRSNGIVFGSNKVASFLATWLPRNRSSNPKRESALPQRHRAPTCTIRGQRLSSKMSDWRVRALMHYLIKRARTASIPSENCAQSAHSKAPLRSIGQVKCNVIRLSEDPVIKGQVHDAACDRDAHHISPSDTAIDRLAGGDTNDIVRRCFVTSDAASLDLPAAMDGASVAIDKRLVENEPVVQHLAEHLDRKCHPLPFEAVLEETPSERSSRKELDKLERPPSVVPTSGTTAGEIGRLQRAQGDVLDVSDENLDPI
eukprot:TRINITY_DN186_c2_g1_i1.p1 TRINITY_DN186_c2_g1~~TRINITY_DN186_c2_g1_i1.p1  ORF type:complete len:492 (-),score=38.57 TRINITY_DN186_c2_g1_i1:9-1484(-)